MSLIQQNQENCAKLCQDVGVLCVMHAGEHVYEWHKDGLWASLMYPTRGAARKALARRCRIDHAFDLTHGVTYDHIDTLLDLDVSPGLVCKYFPLDNFYFELIFADGGRRKYKIDDDVIKKKLVAGNVIGCLPCGL